MKSVGAVLLMIAMSPYAALAGAPLTHANAASARVVPPHGAGEQRLDPSAARQYLQKLQENPGTSFAAAAERLREKGFEPTTTVDVIRSGARLRGRVHSDHAVVPAQSYSDGAAEMVFWSWDDGNNANWEGVVYVQDYATGASATYSTQIDVSTEDFYTVWEEQTGYVPPPPDDMYMTAAPPRTTVPQVASLSPVAVAGEELLLVQSRPSIKSWLGCVYSTCGRTAFLMCVTYGPHCVTGGCGGAAIRCAVQTLLPAM